MLQLCCTKKVRAQFGIAEDSLCDPEASNGVIGNWYVNIFTITRSKCVLFMSEPTLLSFLIFGLRKDNTKNITQTFMNGMLKLLAGEGFNETQIEACLGNDRVLTVTKTINKKALGSMNGLIQIYEQKVLSQGGFQSCDLSGIISSTNRMPQRTLGWGFPIDIARELAHEKSV